MIKKCCKTRFIAICAKQFKRPRLMLIMGRAVACKENTFAKNVLFYVL